MLKKEQIAERFRTLQDDICLQLEIVDAGGKFVEDNWIREEGGGGRSRVIEGTTIEKGGVMFSAVHGPLPEPVAKSMQLPPTDFFATGVSIVLHPHSPMAPIIHMNVRYFETGTGRWWFGGGIDLTPHYVVPDDARFFHKQLKTVCDRFHPAFYPDFKRQADNYFFLKHRQETRGIGGIFFDYLDEKCSLAQEKLFEFAVAVGETFAPTYSELLRRAQDRPWGEREKRWQMLRRGRYVEFNLVWDRGTKFGLETNGRVESILMSMPPTAQWAYNFQPENDSPEAETLTWAKKRGGVDLISFTNLANPVNLAINHVMKKKNDLSLQDAMQDMLKEYRLKPQFDETRVKSLWEKMMGKTIATYTSNIAVRKNVLYLTILSAPLKHELSFAKDKIKARLNEEMGEDYIKDVVIR